MTHYIYKAGKAGLAPILLLHSTGGDEEQLLPLAQQIAPESPVLSIRGRVAENGVNRYFRLRGQGFTKENFDLVSLAEESKWLADEIVKLADFYQLDSEKFTVIGYSNGANVALYMNLAGIFKFDKIIAFHAMQLTEMEQIAQSNSKIFLTNAENDSIVSVENFNGLLADLSKTGSQTEIFKTNAGHQLTESEVNAAKDWLHG